MASIMSLNLSSIANCTSTATATATGTPNSAVSTPCAALIQQDQPQTLSNTASNFSVSDFLVPGLQSKVWEDWQGMVDMSDYTRSWNDGLDTQDSSELSAMFGFDGLIGNTPIWSNAMIPGDYAYDELVFDLAPSAFAPPTTINVADLIVGSNSGASSVSPSELSLPAHLPSDTDNYQDLALASLYGFTEPENDLVSSGSDSEMDDDDEEEENMEDVDSSDDGDEEDSDENNADLQAALLATAKEAAHLEQQLQQQQQQRTSDNSYVLNTETTGEPHEDFQVTETRVCREDPNKRRMEEALVARISNDLGPEHMAGLFQILKGSSDIQEEEEEEEMEVDLSRLDETTLVQVYQYVESCCMQTMRSIMAAEEREIAAATAAAAADTTSQENESGKKQRFLERTPDLELCFSGSSSSSSSSVSPSPPHPSSSSSKGRGAYSKKRPASPSLESRNDPEIEQDSQVWTHINNGTTGKRKRGNGVVNTGAATTASLNVGGGATKKGRRTAKDERQAMIQVQEPIVLHVHRYGEEAEMDEDDEIDVVGI
ncbi:hypothetical protein BG004_007162 [Podila humilis]|nr:hypothetical protein BG004_007162 [Podila humilis]